MLYRDVPLSFKSVKFILWMWLHNWSWPNEHVFDDFGRSLRLKNSSKHPGSNFNRMNGSSCPRCLPDQWLAVCKGGVQYILLQLGDKYSNKCFVVLVINVSIVTSTDSNHKIGFRFFLMHFYSKRNLPYSTSFSKVQVLMTDPRIFETLLFIQFWSNLAQTCLILSGNDSSLWIRLFFKHNMWIRKNISQRNRIFRTFFE